MTAAPNTCSSARRAPSPVVPALGLKRLRRLIVVPRLVARSTRLRGVWLVLAMVGCEDFPDAPTSTVTVQQPPGAPWPQELFVKDTSLLTINVADEAGTVITGLQVQWQSSDASVLEVRPVEPAGQTHEDSLVAQRSVRIVAQRRGKATISARNIQAGIESVTLSQEVRVMERWIAVSAGSSHSCGITIDHDAFCWGTGLLGNGSAAGSVIPVPVGRGLKFRSLTAGDGHTCGVLLDHTVQCWGSNGNGELGTGGVGDQALPVLLSGISILDSVFAGDGYVCGVSATNSTFCWGTNAKWQLGDGFIRPFSPPNGRPEPAFDDCGILFPSLCSRRPRPVRDRGSPAAEDGVPLALSSVAPAVTHTCALRLPGAAVCWGEGSVQLGSGVALTTDSSSAEAFVSVPGGLAFQHIAAGDRHTCAVGRSDGIVYCWGFNSHGQLGTATPDSTCKTQSIPPVVGCSRSPTAAFRGLRSVSVFAGGNSTCALASDSAGYCWGSNEFGQLGDPTAGGACDAGTACRSSAVKVDIGGEPLVSLSVGATHVCAVTARGAAICWGDSSKGRLGRKSVNGTGVVGPSRVDEPEQEE